MPYVSGKALFRSRWRFYVGIFLVSSGLIWFFPVLFKCLMFFSLYGSEAILALIPVLVLIVCGLIILIIEIDYRRRELQTISIDKNGIAGRTFAGKLVYLSWLEISQVHIRCKSVLINAPNNDIGIGTNFSIYPLIAKVIRKACEMKDIECINSYNEIDSV